jgi:hypothetical protein
MKKVFSILFVAVLLVAGTALDVQAQKKKKKGDSDASSSTAPTSSSNESLLLGKWKFDVEHFKGLMKKEADKVRSTNPEKASEIESGMEMLGAMLGSMTIEYKKGGEMETSVMGSIEKGTWRLEDGGKTLVQKGKDNESKSRIIEITASKLVLESGEGDEKMQIQFIK